MTRVPYLQGEGPNTMTICWHDTAQLGTTVEYGITAALGSSTQGTSEIVSLPYRWHTVKLTGLQANTHYFYKVLSGTGSSAIYSFKTLPDASYTGKIRFVILGDTHVSDTIMSGKVLRAVRSKVTELYGPDIENHINGIFHTGDIVVSGSIPEQYTLQYFHPLANLSTSIPTKVVAGNHEGESSYFYKYLKLDDFSAYPLNTSLNEKLWSQKIGNSLFIGLNANIINQYGSTEADWLDLKLFEAEMDPNIDFVFLFIHHPPISELWYDAIINDAGSVYVRNVLIPIIKNYTKVRQLNYGHTHGFERGTMVSDKVDGDFRIICGGGGGGALDPPAIDDYNDIHISLSNYCFQILEIDIANHSYKNSLYSLGDLSQPLNSVCFDSWYKKLNQSAPAAPIAEGVEFNSSYIQFSSSEFSGADSIMSVQLQVFESSGNAFVLDSVRHWKDINGVDNNNNPIDKNLDINLYQTKINPSLVLTDKTYYFQVRYRDHNLKWSNWSNTFPFTITGAAEELLSPKNYQLKQNFPNPFQNFTTIKYYIPERSAVKFYIYDAMYRKIADMDEGVKDRGTYQVNYEDFNLCSGVYYYRMISNNRSFTKKMVKI